MKKTEQIVISIVVAVALVVTAGAMWFFFGGTTADEPKTEVKGLTILDAQGQELIHAKNLAEIYDSEYWAYLEIVLSETYEVLEQKEESSGAEIRKKLFTEGYRIYTAFDPAAYKALAEVSSGWEECETAGVITDLKGSLLAVCCTDTTGKQINYTQERRSPYSSFKALSVYTPAIEKGIATWSTVYQDSPYKQLKNANGELQDWPANASGTYSEKNLPVYEALRKSLNTIAVKCLKDVGIPESIAFLQDNFGIALKEEQYVVQTYGEEEVVGNIALGYLEAGITPVEMAGYYQIFANGGIYTPPKSVEKICLEDGTEYFVQQRSSKQVISEATADLMNKLLQGVVAEGGTGESAQCYNVEVAGKTGTGDNYADNWFVGVTPGYSLALWHGQHDNNQADEMFYTAVQALYRNKPDTNKKFVTHKNLQKLVYCAESGMLISPSCATIDVGYYGSADALPTCDKCGNHQKGDVEK